MMGEETWIGWLSLVAFFGRFGERREEVEAFGVRKREVMEYVDMLEGGQKCKGPSGDAKAEREEAIGAEE